MTPQETEHGEASVGIVLSRPDEPLRLESVPVDLAASAEVLAERCRALVYSEDCRQDRVEPRASLPTVYRQLRLFHVRLRRYLGAGTSVSDQGVTGGDVVVLGRAPADSLQRDIVHRRIPDRVGDHFVGDQGPRSSAGGAGERPGTAEAQRSGLEPGEQLGRFRIVGRLGRGGQGSVYHALTLDWRECVLKRLEHSGPHAIDDEARFEREARLLQAVSHPNLVRCEEFFVHAGRQYLVMEKLDGLSLRRLVGNTGPLPLPLFSLLAAQLVSAVAHLHAMEPMPIVHRDLKPENVFVVVGSDGRFLLKVLDFGLAKHLGHDGAHETFSTALDAPPAGTPQYIPPELLRGQPRGLTGDVFTLGTILYEMYHGVLAFPAEREELWTQILFASPARLPATPRPLRDVLERCLEKFPEMRYPDARELLPDLHHALGQLAGRAATPSIDSLTTERLSPSDS